MIQVAVLGYGTVGSGVVEVIETNKAVINKKAGTELNIKYILDLRDFPGDPYEDKAGLFYSCFAFFDHNGNSLRYLVHIVRVQTSGSYRGRSKTNAARHKRRLGVVRDCVFIRWI